MSRKAKLAIFVPLLIVALLIATAGAAAAFYAHRALPNSYIAGIKVGGSPQVDVEGVVLAQLASFEQTPITVTSNNTSATFLPREIGIDFNNDATINQAFDTTGTWGWLTPHYWQNFFKRKDYTFLYSLNKQTAQSVIDTKLNLGKDSQDAALTIVNNQLSVVPGASGQEANIDTLNAGLRAAALSAQPGVTIALGTAEHLPNISTDVAAQTKTEIDSTLKPITLQGNGKAYTISVADQLNLITFSANKGAITWVADGTKLRDYTTKKIAKALNIAMVPQSTTSDTAQVVTQGKDGQSVDVDKLLPLVSQAIIHGTTDSITVPLKTVSFTQQTIYPDFTAGTFPGLYLDVNLKKQKMSVLNGTTLIAQYSVSTGKWSTPTPTGVLYVFNKIPEAYSRPFRLWMPRWSGLAKSPDGAGYVGYGIHGLVCWDKACTNREGVAHIGEPVSHGCIRVEDAGIQYIYDNIPVGTPVNIHAI